MDVDRIRDSPIGQLVPVQGTDGRHGEFAHFAFLPDPLPNDVQLTSMTWTSVARASSALASLNTACKQLPNPRLLISPALWREALDTSALEGTYGALRDLLEAQLPSTQFLSPETVEILAYVRTAERAFDMVEENPISLGMLNVLQAELFQDDPNPPRDVGRTRQDIVWIGPQDRPIGESRYVPPPAGPLLETGLAAWEEWVQAEHEHLPPLVRAALAHYQFEALHPFADGNGRLGRLIVVLQLLRAGVIEHPAITVSPWLLKRRHEYQDHLLALSCAGDWNPWVHFFCQAVEAQSEALVIGADRLLMWLRDSREAVNQRRWTGAIHRLLSDLVQWPVTTVADTAERYDVSTMNATRMIGHLVEIGVLTELTGKTYGRVFGATEVIEIVEAI